MTCESVQGRFSSLLDRLLTDEQRGDVLEHLEACRRCSAQFESIQNLRVNLRKLDRAPMPAGLDVRLRVLASHERVRRLATASLSARLQYWRARVRLHFENLMKPIAVPVAGGLFSALLLFGMVMPSLSFRYNLTNDPQLAIISDPDGMLVGWTGYAPHLESANSISSGDEGVIELTIDDQGRVVDYSVSPDQLTPDMQSIILFSRLTPATFFGKSTWGKKLVRFPRARNSRT